MLCDCRSVRHINPGMADKHLPDKTVESALRQLFAAFENHAETATASTINTTHIVDQFHKAATHPDRTISEHLTTGPKEKNSDINHSYHTLPNNSSVEHLLHHRNLKILEKNLGFTVERRLSQIEGGGTGVFVTSGTIPPYTIAALYPGKTSFSLSSAGLFL